MNCGALNYHHHARDQSIGPPGTAIDLAGSLVTASCVVVVVERPARNRPETGSYPTPAARLCEWALPRTEGGRAVNTSDRAGRS